MRRYDRDLRDIKFERSKSIKIRSDGGCRFGREANYVVSVSVNSRLVQPPCEF